MRPTPEHHFHFKSFLRQTAGITLNLHGLRAHCGSFPGQQWKNIYAVTDGDPMVLRIPIKNDGTAGEPVALPSGYSAFDGIELDSKGNIYVSEILLNQIWVLSPDGSQRILIATKQNAPLDNNTSLVLKADVLCTANLGFTHAKPEEADRTVVCMKGFPLPK